MADTSSKSHHALPVESDGIQYSGITWFLVILVGTVIVCQVFVWGMFALMESRAVQSEAVRAPLADAASEAKIDNGRLLTGREVPAAAGAVASPGLLVDEPSVLGVYRRNEEQALSTYGWVNQAAGVVRLPINRAKELVLERGLPVRAPSAPAAPVATPAAAPAASR